MLYINSMNGLFIPSIYLLSYVYSQSNFIKKCIYRTRSKITAWFLGLIRICILKVLGSIAATESKY